MKKKAYFTTIKGYATLFLILIFLILLSIRLGSASMSSKEFIEGLFFKNETNAIIIYNIRLPRIIAAILAGIGLSISGVLLQTIFDNPLAAPSIIGINSGAGFFVALLLFISASTNVITIFLTPVFAFFGALLATILILFLSTIAGGTKSSVILAGVAVNTILNALISLITLINNDILISYNSFSIGGFSGVQYQNLIAPAIIILIIIIFSILLSKNLNILCLGKQSASTLGVNVNKIKIIAIILASAAASCVVSFAGLLGFIGLVVPHISRFLSKNNTKSTIINSVLLGSIITIIADLLGRTLFSPTEMPVGIMMAFIGGPFFIFLLCKQRGKY